MTSSLSFSSPSNSHSSQTTLVRVAPATLHALSAAVTEALAQSSADISLALQDAGYAGGDAFYSAFQQYAAQRGHSDVHHLRIETFFQLAGAFFTESGWGQTTLSEQDGAFCLIEIAGTWDDDTRETGAYITIGVLSAFLERFADYPVSVLELDEIHGAIPTRRFLAGPMAAIAGYYAQHNDNASSQ